MKVLILAPGAVGCYFGARLAQSGAEVSVVARRDYEVALRSGYRIESVAGNFLFHPHHVLKSADETEEIFDYVFVTAKAYADSTALLRGAVRSPETAIVLIQNGIDTEKEVKNAYPRNEVISSVAYICVSRPAPGVVLHQDGGRLQMGTFPAGKITPKLEKLRDAFASGGVPCSLCENVQHARWEKLLWNLPYNTVSVLAGGADTTMMKRSTGLGKICSALMDELISVAGACGVALSRADAEKKIELTESLAPFKTSMLQDFEAHRPLEVEPIVGNVLKLAIRYGVDTPAISFCYHLLTALNRRNLERNH